MTTSQNAAQLYDAYLRQVAAESYLESRTELGNERYVRERLFEYGSNRIKPTNEKPGGFTRLTDKQFDDFWSKYRVVDQTSDNPADSTKDYLFPNGPVANTGFSATLLRDLDPSSKNFYLSFRSTEFKTEAEGGDRPRDAAADMDIFTQGFSWAQIDAMEKYYDHLKASGKLPADAQLYVSGYSLGGHLAAVFTELHPNAVQSTTVFNSPGRGALGWGSLQQMLTRWREVMANPASAPEPVDPNTTSQSWPLGSSLASCKRRVQTKARLDPSVYDPSVHSLSLQQA